MKKEYEKRPWGEFEKFVDNKKCSVKILTINAGKAFSLQYHKSREEFWLVLEGEGIFTVGKNIKKGIVGDEFLVKKKEKHHIENRGKKTLKVLEISFGKFKEDDIVRLEDKYNRA